MLVIINEGWLSGFFDRFWNKNKTISFHIITTLSQYIKIDILKEIHSTHPFSKRRVKKLLDKSKDNKVLLIGKSKGAHEIYQLMRDEPQLFDKFEKVGVFLIDGHSPWWTGEFFGRGQEFERLDIWNRFVIVNIFQKDKKPNGAEFRNADVNRQVENSDHFKIVKSHIVKDELMNLCKYLVF